MSSSQTESISHLPLSWARTNAAAPSLNMVKLPFSSSGWIPTAEIPHDYSFEQIYREHLSTLPNGFVLQSCGLALRDYLIQQGSQVAAMGAEAVLDLPWRGKRSVRELARRGQRHGAVRETELSQINRHKLAKLISEASARQVIQLRHTERSQFDASTRCFVFETAEQEWLGAMTLSGLSPKYLHAELLLRRRDAPAGIMEALITAIAQQLAVDGINHLSLGNVTPVPAAESAKIFAPHRLPNELWRRSQLTFRLGRALNFAFNADGLWQFKNKFSPRWQPLYLCASPRLSWITVAGLVQATGYFNLVWNELLGSWPNSIPSTKAPFPVTGTRPSFGT